MPALQRAWRRIGSCRPLDQGDKDGDGWIVSGQKVWTSYAHLASFGILLARTDPDAPKHAGISYFVCPMDAPGVTIRPIVDMTGDHAFNEVFLDDVHLGPEHLVGRPGQGWSLAKVTLSNERVSLSGEGALWGQGPTASGPRRRPCETPAGSPIRCCDSGSPPSGPRARSYDFSG